MKAKLFIGLLIAMVAGEAQELCFSLSLPKEEEINLFQKIYAIEQKDVATKILERKTLFTKEYIIKYGLSEEDKNYLQIFIKKYLAKRYIEKLLQQHLPNDKEAKSYYLIHKDRYKAPFESIKNRIKEDMVRLKAIKLTNEEYKRLKEKYEK